MDETNYNTILCDESLEYNITLKNDGLSSTNSCDLSYKYHGDLYLERKPNINQLFWFSFFFYWNVYKKNFTLWYIIVYRCWYYIYIAKFISKTMQVMYRYQIGIIQYFIMALFAFKFKIILVLLYSKLSNESRPGQYSNLLQNFTRHLLFFIFI